MSDFPDDNSEFLDEDPEEAFDAEQFSQQFDDQLLNETDDGENVETDEETTDNEALNEDESEDDEFDDDTFEDFGDADSEELPDESEDADANEEHFDVNPTSILEGMLFVGNPKNQSVTAAEMSSLMRGVAEDDIDELVAELNESYRSSQSPYQIVFENGGYQLVLAKEFEFCRGRFYREEKAATLSQSVVDVLSLVAYLQPVTKKALEEKRMKPSGSILNQLVRRRLIQIEQKKEEGQRRQKYYKTTERFLDLFGLSNLEELPQSQTFENLD